MISSERYKILKPLQQNTKQSKYLVFDELDKCKRVISESSIKLKEPFDINDISKIEHLGMPQITDAFESNNTYCLVYEYIEGETIKEYIDSKGVMNLFDTLDIYLNILYTVKFLHEIKPQGIIHGNIHHDNILLKNDEVYLTDYGIKDESKNPYQAPEAILGMPKTVQQDIYSLGMLLNFMITGKFKKNFYSQKKTSLADALIMRCTMVSYKSRFEDVGILISECERIIKKIKMNRSGPIAETFAITGPVDAVFNMAKAYSKETSKKTLIIDTDILHPSFSATYYSLNHDLQTLMDQDDTDVKQWKKALKGTNVYIIPSALQIEAYENISFTSFENMLSIYMEEFQAVFIRCADFIYDSLTINSYLLADRIIYIMTDPLRDICLFNAICEYLCARHDIDKKRFNCLSYQEKSENIITCGLQSHTYGEYLGAVRQTSKPNGKAYKKVLSRLIKGV